MAKTTQIVAITGGIGAGKSAVADLFQELGASVVDADQLARDVVLPGTAGLQAVQAAFPAERLIRSDGSLDRQRLGEVIFGDSSKRKTLEGILHPLIRALWLSKLEQLKGPGATLVAYVIPLLFESKTPMPELQKVILVTAPEQLRIERIVARDGLSAEAARQRLNSQLPDSEKITRSNYVISNDSTHADLRKKVQQVFAELTSPV
jgi:dephospho-CoA kinase